MKTVLKEQIAKKAADQLYDAYPSLWERFGERGFEHTEKDNMHHLDHLETAYDLNDRQVFLEYTLWLEKILSSRNVETALITDNFERLISLLNDEVEPEEKEFMQLCLQESINLLKGSTMEKGS